MSLPMDEEKNPVPQLNAVVIDDISGYLPGIVRNVLEGDQGSPAYPCSRKLIDNPPCSTWPKGLELTEALFRCYLGRPWPEEDTALQ